MPRVHHLLGEKDVTVQEQRELFPSQTYPFPNSRPLDISNGETIGVSTGFSDFG
jgi:hypothetical protein